MVVGPRKALHGLVKLVPRLHLEQRLLVALAEVVPV